jgi:glycine/D-amino acid oxidase-like deaminating enzyme
MRKNLSPWLHQLDAAREAHPLSSDLATDTAIVGAGIAGVATAFFALKYADQRVTLIDRYKLAHGATGNNAGQVVSYFERGFASIVEEYGLGPAARAQKAVEDAWELLDEMYTDAGLDIPFSRFIGHAGLSSYEQVMLHLKENLYRRKAGLNTERILIAEDAECIPRIPPEYVSLYRRAPRKEVLRLLETESPQFVAAVSSQKGCLNSALFCQEVISYLTEEYKERFVLYEHTPVHKVVLKENHALLDASTHTVEAKRVVLCTNGFEDLTIINETGLDIDTRFHRIVRAYVAYMSGYIEKLNKPPIALSYYTDPSASIENNYFYLTRRPFEYEEGLRHNLVCIGGPDVSLEESEFYSHEQDFPDEMERSLDRFIRGTYDTDPNKKIDYLFTWHGLMGYTQSGVRMIGPEPVNGVLLYNLGCNGVGILPSVYGGRKIARHLSGAKVSPSIFDVPSTAAPQPSPVTGDVAQPEHQR